VTIDPLVLGAEVNRATERLLASVGSLDEAQVAGPSLLPGWSRGHVLSHLARNADSYFNLLTWARTGVETPQYAEPGRRDAEIAAGAGRPPAAQLTDLRESHQRFAAAVDAMTPAGWATTIRYGSGTAAKAPHVVWARLREVEVHHVDLNVGYGPGSWSDAFTLRLLHEVSSGFAGTGPPVRVVATDLDFRATIGAAPTGDPPAPTTVQGPARSLAAWLVGRSTGDPLTATPPGPLPPVPTWK
jgi:maleylpyruvate isomerase